MITIKQFGIVVATIPSARAWFLDQGVAFTTAALADKGYTLHQHPRHGDTVTLSSPYGATQGVLVLNEWEQDHADTTAYGTWTLELSDGSRFRSEGRIET